MSVGGISQGKNGQRPQGIEKVKIWLGKAVSKVTAALKRPFLKTEALYRTKNSLLGTTHCF